MIDGGAMRVLDSMGQNQFGKMTLGRLIKELEKQEAAHMAQGNRIDETTGKSWKTSVEILGCGYLTTEVGSYRGSYEHLYISWTRDYDKAATRAEVIAALKGAVGKTFDGYKGGDYRMHEGTTVFFGQYGTSHGGCILGVAGWSRLNTELVTGPEDAMPHFEMPALEEIQKLHRDEITRATNIAWDAALDAVRTELVGWRSTPILSKKASEHARKVLKKLAKVKSEEGDIQ